MSDDRSKLKIRLTPSTVKAVQESKVKTVSVSGPAPSADMVKIQKFLDAKLKSKNMEKLTKSLLKKFPLNGQIAGFAKPMPKVVILPTGYREIDIDILECGGIPKGTIGEFFGPESGGKTTLALTAMAGLQRLHGATVAFVDMEHSMTDSFAQGCGIDTSKWLYLRPMDGEECIEMLQMLCAAGIDVVAVDSWGALFSRSVLEKEVSERDVLGARANLIGRGIKLTLKDRHIHGTIVICINQLRDKIGAMAFQEKTQTTGGWEVRHAYNWRIRVDKGEKIKGSHGQVTGIRTKMFGTKNKVGQPFRRAELEIVFGSGVSIESSLFHRATSLRILDKAGSWFSFNGERVAQGAENVKAMMRTNGEFCAQLMEACEMKEMEIEMSGATEYGVDDFSIADDGFDV